VWRELIHNVPKLKTRRQKLRNSVTEAEALLWQRLKNSKLGFKFRRQHSVSFYVLDFYCPSKKLAIELDGAVHLKRKEYDKYRTEYLKSFNIKVLRFWDGEVVTDPEKVVSRIEKELSLRIIPPLPAKRASPPKIGGD